ncbi:hypothetical protein [Kytococcus sedentarius]|uniref:biotin synthase auxiliary protein BsaP n=1 Tax=Kytococcus sedentarius TaxID=1276 RepID=UPI00384E0868
MTDRPSPVESATADRQRPVESAVLDDQHRAAATTTHGADRGHRPGCADAEQPVYCGHCGEPLVDQDGAPQDHAPCARRLELEPPRYCPACRRRMVVQVTPRGWTASCSRHGVTTS